MKKILIRKEYQNMTLIIFIVLSTILSLQIRAQTISINGVVSTSSTAVHNALVSFIDNSDTSTIYSAVTDTSGNYQIEIIISSVKPNDYQPTNFVLQQNYPNPFTSSTDIPYQLKTQSDVQVTVYDILGREIKKFNVGVQQSGTHGVMWDGKNNFGERVATGIYFYQLQANGETQVKKMVFGTGEGNFILSPLNMSPSPLPKMNNGFNTYLEENNFTVRIENTDSTFPVIIPEQVDNIIVQNDTTLNFTVDEYEDTLLNAATIYLDSTRQIIRGYGAANIVGWRTDMTADQVNTAFGTGPDQVGFTLLRLRIPFNSNDFNLQVPTAQLAYNMGVQIIASPWTPPAWMKTNNNTIGGSLRDTSYASYAAHLKSFADYMSNNGVDLYAISVQNEPDVSVTYESCDWNADQMLRFVKENAPSIGTKIFAPESFEFNRTISDAILNDSVAASNLAFVGEHIYGGELESYPLAESKGKEIWMTEHYTESGHSANDWPLALDVATEINDCMNAGMSAYVWWYIVRFYGPIGDGSNNTVLGGVTKRGYIMSQYSRFVRPGSYRVEATQNPQDDIYVTAYKDSSKVVVVAVNYGSQSITQSFKIDNGTVNNVTPYVTSETKNCSQESDITVSKGVFTTTLDGSSVTTFVSE